MSRRSALSGVLATAASALLVFSWGSAAAASPQVATLYSDSAGEDLKFVDTSPSVEYGTWLNLDFTAHSWLATIGEDSINNVLHLTSSDVPGDFKSEISTYGLVDQTKGTAFQAGDGRPLAAGTYTFTLKLHYDDGTPGGVNETSPPATVTVTPAALTTELNVIPDPSAAHGVIVSSRLSGPFADNFGSQDFPNAPLAPKGVWHFEITDSTGAVAAQQDQPSDGSLASSFYWGGAQAGTDYSATVKFSSASETASNFAIADATPVTFTGASSPRPEPTSTAAAAPIIETPTSTGFQLPVWLVVLLGIIITGLAAAAVVMYVRVSRASVAGNTGGTNNVA